MPVDPFASHSKREHGDVRKVFAKLGISSGAELIRLARGGDNQRLASDSAAAPT